jgi:predicted ATPase
MTTREVVESLGDGFSLGGRKHGVSHHRTLRDTMQWSYDLLEETEQAVFDRLSVFAGRFSREAALAVGADRGGIPPSPELAALVDASMIVADVSGRATSYRMLPTLRDFGVFNLREGGELESVRRAHAEYLTADAKDMVLPYAQNQPTRRVEQNASVEDFRAAAEWALHAGRPELAPTLVVALNHHSISGRRLDEAADWIRRVTEFAVEGSFEMWQLQMTSATIAHLGGSESVEAAFRSLSASAAEMGEAAASADALQYAGHVLWRSGDLRGARDAMATAAGAASPSDWSSGSKREILAEIELQLGNITAAEQQADVLATFIDRTYDPVASAAEIHIRGWVAYYRGKLDESTRLLENCRNLAIEEGDFRHNMLARLGLARVFAARGLPDQALAQAQTANDAALAGGREGLHERAFGYHGQSMILIGRAQLDLGHLPQAARPVAEGLEILRNRHPSVGWMSRGLRFGGWIALAHGHSDLAVRFQAAAEAEFQRIGLVAPPAEAAHAAHALAEARQLLGEAEQDVPTNRVEHAPFATVLNEAIGYLHQVAEGTG